MVVIRLSRRGAKKRPFYHVVVADRRSPRDGDCIERVGYYNPIASGKDVDINLKDDRILYWISKGAQPSDVVRSLMRKLKRRSLKTESDAKSLS